MPASSKVRALRFGGAHGVSLTALRRRALPAALVALALAAPAAQAEEVFTSQAATARATDSTWIPAPPKPAAVCIVDTGNDPNPDTTNVIARLSVDGGDGSDLDTTGHHGTLMSMIASAPYNGFGMVGVAPSVKVVSVRATRPGNGGGFAFSDVLNALQTCVNYRLAHNIRVVSLSLGVGNDGQMDAASQNAMENYVGNARRAGLSVVAAAGNHPGSVDYPAAYGPVLAVAASDGSGSLCSFSAFGPEVDLIAAGCPQDVALPDGHAAWASGSSESAVLVATVLAQLRGLRPELSPDAAEDLLKQAARRRAQGLELDVLSAFGEAGLASQLALGRSAIPTPNLGPPESEATNDPHPTAAPVGAAEPSAEAIVAQPAPTGSGAWPSPATDDSPYRRPLRLLSPRARLTRDRSGRVNLAMSNKPARAEAVVRIYVRQRGRPFPRIRALCTRADRLRVQVSGVVSQVSITYRDPAGDRAPSFPLTLRP